MSIDPGKFEVQDGIASLELRATGLGSGEHPNAVCSTLEEHAIELPELALVGELIAQGLEPFRGMKTIDWEAFRTNLMEEANQLVREWLGKDIQPALKAWIEDELRTTNKETPEEVIARVMAVKIHFGARLAAGEWNADEIAAEAESAGNHP